MQQNALESNSTFMSSDEWNKSDHFVLHLFSTNHLMVRGFEGLEGVLGVIESLDVELRPDQIRHTRRKRKYSRQVLHEHLHEAYIGDVFDIKLARSKPPSVTLALTSREYETGIRAIVEMWVTPFNFFREPGRAGKHAEHIVSFDTPKVPAMPYSYDRVSMPAPPVITLLPAPA
jgi:hypothetical protein